MTAALALQATQSVQRPIIGVRLDSEYSANPLLDNMLGGVFSALGESHLIGTDIDWRHNPSADIEWLIILNKFYHAPGLVQAWIDNADRRYLDMWKRQLCGWIATMESGFIAADVTGRRLQNWIYALTLWRENGSDQDVAFRALADRSIATQAEWLRANLHPARNHRTLELLALLLASVWLDDSIGATWAMAALTENAASDFLPDGVHVELSSHYHCLALRNFLDAINVASDNGIAVPAALSRIVGKAEHFAHVLHKPDGFVPALSDADVGDYRAMLGAAPSLGQCELFPDAGYVFLRDAAAVAGDPDGQYLVFDCGPLGEGNHGHLDCLSFELAAFGRSLIVDPGRYTYYEGGPTNERAAFRGTAAHNVVQVDSREQTAYRQGPKRMKIAGPAPDTVFLHADAQLVHARAASHQANVINERIIVRSNRGWWLIHDRLISETPHDYDLRFQLSPEAQDHVHQVELASGTRAFLSPELLVVPLSSDAAELTIEQGWFAPRYGERHAAPRLRIGQQATTGWFSTLLIPFRGEMPDIDFACDGSRIHVRFGEDAPEEMELPC